MSDLVKRCRENSKYGCGECGPCDECGEAAARIEADAARIERLEAFVAKVRVINKHWEGLAFMADTIGEALTELDTASTVDQALAELDDPKP